MGRKTPPGLPEARRETACLAGGLRFEGGALRTGEQQANPGLRPQG
jgi:hypothetical protein